MRRLLCFFLGWLLLAGCEVLPPSLEMEMAAARQDAGAVAAFDASPAAPQDASVEPLASADAAVALPIDAAVPPQTDASTGGQGVSFGPSCSFAVWPSPDVLPAYHTCSLPPASGCSCNGVAKSAPPTDVVTCLQTLASVCGVDTTVRTGCEHPYGGGCWPSASASDAWLCECRTSGQRAEVRGASCRAAGETLCKPPLTPCEDQTGRCKPNAEGKFTCECPVDFPAMHTINADQCLKALRVACVGSLGTATAGDDCMSQSFALSTPPAGACFGKGRMPQDGFACHCDLGDGNLRQGKVVAPSCAAALGYFCPEAAPK
jgi:hypothetical protein